MREKILEYVEIDDLQPELQEVARVAGMRAIRALLLEVEGERLLFRMYTSLRQIRQRYARANYKRFNDGRDNVMKLARDLSVTPQTVRRYLRE